MSSFWLRIRSQAIASDSISSASTPLLERCCPADYAGGCFLLSLRRTKIRCGEMAATDGDGMVPLAVLLRREMSWERIEKPDIIYGEASERKKGEDFTLVITERQRVPRLPDTAFSVFAVMPLPYQSQISDTPFFYLGTNCQFFVLANI